ncbi:hypothetical protein NECID01_1632 [Nematocida sp. AWRm77]|nr:hypothetical protein NECID01_1632 [Nematocida sp. AWRm77]
MSFQQGSSADHLLDNTSLEYFGLCLFFAGVFWAGFSFVDFLQLCEFSQHRVSERVASLAVYTVLYIMALAFVYAYKDITARKHTHPTK